MPATIYRVHPTLRRHGWRALLRQWAALMDEWCKAGKPGKKEVPYWYGERALTGLLAAAAWKLTNGMSLLEIEAKRGSRGQGERIRLDAWVVLGRVYYQIEAKYPVVYGIRGDTAGVAIRKVCNELKEALRQVRKVPDNYSGDGGLALCYLVHMPQWRERPKDRPGAELLKQVACHFDSRPYTLSAVYTPPEGQTPEFWWKEGRRSVWYYCVGVALVGQAAWLPHRGPSQ